MATDPDTICSSQLLTLVQDNRFFVVVVPILTLELLFGKSRETGSAVRSRSMTYIITVVLTQHNGLHFSFPPLSVTRATSIHIMPSNAIIIAGQSLLC